MTTFTSSRLGVFGRLLGFPFIVAAYAARAAAAEFRTEFGALKTDFVPAVRYVATGNPEKSLVAHAGDKVTSVRERMDYVFTQYAKDRLIALLILLAMPIIAIVAMYITLRDDDYFADMRDVVVGCAKGIITGDGVR